MSTTIAARPDRRTRVGAIVASVVCLGLLWLAVAMLVWRWLAHHVCNHWGFDIRQVYILCAVAAGWAALVFLTRSVPRAMSICLMLSALLCAGLVFFLDDNNLLVKYELWISRGMPGPWE